MACYHFTIKLDKNPDGSKVSAVAHVEYIDREGKYKDYDNEQSKPQEIFQNSMAGDSPIENTLNESTLLYHSPFGSIMRTKDGIAVSDGASAETTAIALAITAKLYSGKLQLNGTNTFKAQVLVVAKEMDLPLHFADIHLEKKYKEMLEEKRNGRTEFERIGGRIRKPKGLSKSDIKRRTLKVITKTGFRLPKLSERHLVLHDQEPDLLLSRDDDADLRYQGSEFYRNVRWDVSGTRRRQIKKVANKVLVNVQKHVEAVSASSHLEYINRDAAFKQRGGCIYKNHHLPKWAKDSSKRFFAMADEYERSNGVRYKEIEFALPNELNLEQQKEIIEQFIENHLKDFYYAYAIHDKIGVMSNGEHNTHVHIMFSERKIDEAEKLQERSGDKFFAKAFPLATTIEAMQRGGAKKDPKWNSKNRAKYLSIMREDFAKIQNTILEKYDIPDRVDHRSLKVQMEEARTSGNMRLAELLNRMPEEHIGPDNALNKNNQKVIELQKYRAYKAEHQKLLYIAELMENSIAADIAKQETAQNTENVAKITHLEEYKKAQESNSTVLHRLKNDMLHALKEVTALNGIVIWNKDAVDIAKLKFLTLDEKKLWQSLKSLQKEKSHWMTFKKNFKKPASYQQEELEAYNNLQPELNRQLTVLDEQVKKIATKLEPIHQKLASPIMQQKIEKETKKILWEDTHTKERLAQANKVLNSTIEKLQEEIDKYKNMVQDNDEPVFTVKKLQEILSVSYDNLKSEYNCDQVAAKKLESKIISYDRANAMAKNLYVHGKFKTLREEYRALAKKEKYFKNDKSAHEVEVLEFSKQEKPSFWQSKQIKLDYENKQHALTQKSADLLNREEKLLDEKSRLSSEQNSLNALCETDTAKSKIADISMGILKKNQPITDTNSVLINKMQNTLKKVSHTKKQLQAIKKQAAVDKNGTQYKVVKNHISTGGSYNRASAPSIIADAILGYPKAVQLVAHTKPGTGEMEKDWNMMTEIEKDEKLNSIENLDRY